MADHQKDAERPKTKSSPVVRRFVTQTMSPAGGLEETVDSDGWSFIGPRGASVPDYLELGDLRELNDDSGQEWVVRVVDNRVVEGFMLDDRHAGELVLCIAEEEGLGACPGLICRHLRQACRQDSV